MDDDLIIISIKDDLQQNFYAETVCDDSGHAIADHFANVSKMVGIGSSRMCGTSLPNRKLIKTNVHSAIEVSKARFVAWGEENAA